MSSSAMPGRAGCDALLARRDEIARSLVALEFQRHPELAARYGETARGKSIEDAGYHLAFLAQAMALGKEGLFAAYIAWTKVTLIYRGVPANVLADHLQCMSQVMREHLAQDVARDATRIVDATLAQMPAMPDDIASFIRDDSPHAALARHYLKALLLGEHEQAALLIDGANAEGVPLESLYLDVFAATQLEIGRLWQLNVINVAQEHYCTAATQRIMSREWPRIFAAPKGPHAMVATCVAGELHELGPRMVADFFEMSGWRTRFLGANTPHAGVVAALLATEARVLAVSASLGFHVLAVADLIADVRAEPRCAAVHILVGGHPFNAEPSLCQAVGADGHAPDAKAAVALAARLVEHDA